MGGPKEKLVLQHSEFMISQRVQTALLWIEQLRSDLKILDVDVSEKYTADAGEEVSKLVCCESTRYMVQFAGLPLSSLCIVISCKSEIRYESSMAECVPEDGVGQADSRGWSF